MMPLQLAPSELEVPHSTVDLPVVFYPRKLQFVPLRRRQRNNPKLCLIVLYNTIHLFIESILTPCEGSFLYQSGTRIRVFLP